MDWLRHNTGRDYRRAGAIECRQFLAASYEAMAGALAGVKDRCEAGGMGLAALASSTETLLESEHAAWLDRMSRTIVKPPPQGDRRLAPSDSIKLDQRRALWAQLQPAS